MRSLYDVPWSARKEPARKLAQRYNPVTAYGPDHGLPGGVPAAGGYHHVALNTRKSEGREPPAGWYTDPYYLTIVYPDRRELAESGLLEGERSEEVFEVEGRDLCPSVLLRVARGPARDPVDPHG